MKHATDKDQRRTQVGRAFWVHSTSLADGSNLYLGLPISLWEAALGGHVIVLIPVGEDDTPIPKNARVGREIHLQGNGLPGAPVGNIYAAHKFVKQNVETHEACALFETIATEMPFDPRAHLGRNAK